jgi:SAM-dependent methyltransferase
MADVSELRREGNRVLREWLREWAGRVVNLGAGTDRDREGLAYRDYVPAARDYVRIDQGGAGNVRADLASIPEPAESFDGALCLWVLEHVVEPASVLREAARILRRGSPIVLGLPADYRRHGPVDVWRFGAEGVGKLFDATPAFRLRRVMPLGVMREVWMPHGLQWFGPAQWTAPAGFLALGVRA